jgi:hypothetical protein
MAFRPDRGFAIQRFAARAWKQGIGGNHGLPGQARQ